MTAVTFFSGKFIIVYIYFISTLYIHYRGQVRFSFFRQLTDHSTLLAPLNALIYLFSRTKSYPVLNKEDFSELKMLRNHWQMIRDEAVHMYQLGHIKASDKYDDIGFNSFFRSGWKRFYLKWYQDPLPSAQEYCPKTVALLKQIPSVNSAMFALLPKGGHLARHRDPYAGSLRYHLGLMTPNSDKCRIFIDGQEYSWRDGEDLLFDETYIHSAENHSEQDRIILFCDVARPMRNAFGRLINRIFNRILMAASASKNTDIDKIGFINKAFKYIYTIRLVGKKLKKFNIKFYYRVKYCLLLLLAFLFFYYV